MDTKWKIMSHDPGLTQYRAINLAPQLLFKTYTLVLPKVLKKLNIIMNAGHLRIEAARIRLPKGVQTTLQLINACV